MNFLSSARAPAQAFGGVRGQLAPWRVHGARKGCASACNSTQAAEEGGFERAIFCKMPRTCSPAVVDG